MLTPRRARRETEGTRAEPEPARGMEMLQATCPMPCFETRANRTCKRERARHDTHAADDRRGGTRFVPDQPTNQPPISTLPPYAKSVTDFVNDGTSRVDPAVMRSGDPVPGEAKIPSVIVLNGKSRLPFSPPV